MKFWGKVPLTGYTGKDVFCATGCFKLQALFENEGKTESKKHREWIEFPNFFKRISFIIK